MDGSFAWCRVSDSVRYSGATYEVPSRTDPPAVDEHTVAQWNFNEGTGTTLADETGVNNCTIIDGDWEYFNFDNLKTNLASWWDLEEEVATRYDDQGYQDLTDNNTVGRTTGAGADTYFAADFTAANYEYLSHEDSELLSTGRFISFTLSSWVNMETVTDTVFVSKGDAGTGNEYALGYSTAEDKFYFASSSGVAPGYVYADDPSPALVDTWYFLVGWLDIDNDLLGISVDLDNTTAAHAYTGQDNADPFYIGRQGDVYADGRVDTTFLAKRYWNSDERAWAYNGGDGRNYYTVPTPVPTPEPTPTATPIAAAEWKVDLPSGNPGLITASITAGEASIVIVCLALLMLGMYWLISNRIWPWLQK